MACNYIPGIGDTSNKLYQMIQLKIKKHPMISTTQRILFQVAWGKKLKKNNLPKSGYPYQPSPPKKKHKKHTKKQPSPSTPSPFQFLPGIFFSKKMTPGAFLPLAASPDPRGPGLRLPRGAIPPWKPCWIGGVHALVRIRSDTWGGRKDKPPEVITRIF